MENVKFYSLSFVRASELATTYEYGFDQFDEGTGLVYCDHEARELANLRYEELVSDRAVEAGLMEVDRPQREHNYYFVAAFLTDFAQGMIPFAEVGCNYENGGPCLDSGLQQAKAYLGAGWRYDRLLTLFPDEEEKIEAARCAKIIYGIKSLIGSSVTKRDIIRIHSEIDALALRYPNNDDVTDFRSEFTLAIISSEVYADRYHLKRTFTQ